MRRTMSMAGALTLLFLLGPWVGSAEAQAVGETVSLTGCLAADEDDAEEFVLLGVDEDATSAEEIELLAGDGVNLANHVGHTVAATGTVVADDEGHEAEEADEDDEMEEMADEAEDLLVEVSGLRHVAATCE